MNLVTRLLLALAMVTIPLSAWAADYQTGTDAKRDINGAFVDKYRDVKGVRFDLANGMMVLTMPNDEWAVNHTEQGLEFLSDRRAARVGVDAHVAESGWTANKAVSDVVSRLQAAHGGTWAEPKNVNVTGIPTVMASGHDVFGNYYYEIYGVERMGMQYLVWMRTPYENRWNTDLNADVAWIINNIHPSTRMVMQSLKEKRGQ